MMDSVRALAISLAVILTGCAVSSSGRDATTEPWYTQTVARVAQMNRDAETAFKNGKSDQAASLIEQGEPLVKQLLAVPHPSLEAAQAASDLDDLYGRMLLANRHYGWARLQFQKNLSRWKHWVPQTPDTERRYKLALAEIDECDKHITD